ncbi:MAG: hypothetical protein ABI051_03065 [Vicinamibacterales bacterium]
MTAGRALGRNQPLTLASYESGAQVPIVFLPRDPRRARRDEFWDLWAVAMIGVSCIVLGPIFELLPDRGWWQADPSAQMITLFGKRE